MRLCRISLGMTEVEQWLRRMPTRDDGSKSLATRSIGRGDRVLDHLITALVTLLCSDFGTYLGSKLLVEQPQRLLKAPELPGLQRHEVLGDP